MYLILYKLYTLLSYIYTMWRYIVNVKCLWGIVGWCVFLSCGLWLVLSDQPCALSMEPCEMENYGVGHAVWDMLTHKQLGRFLQILI